MNRILFQSIDDIIESNAGLLRRSFPFLLIGVLVICFYRLRPIEPSLFLMSLFMVFLCVLPAWLWVTRRVLGIPIIPILCLNEILWYALPILSGHQELDEYSTNAILKAGLTEIAFLITMIFIWYRMTNRHPRLPATIRALPANLLRTVRLDRFWLIAYSLAVFFVMGGVAGTTERIIGFLPAGSFSVLRTFAAAVGILSIFFLSMAFASSQMSRMLRVYFSILFVFHLLASASSILLVSIVPLLFAFLAGYTIGGGRRTLVILVVVLACLNVLHAGKWPMREKYWPQFSGTQTYLDPWDYPSYYAEWISLGIADISAPVDTYATPEDDTILARTSIIQMVLYAQHRAPEHIPYLNGETIFIIPKLLIPRFLWAGKMRTHEGQIILNVTFGRQDFESAQNTYIAWGMLAELYANFGLWGAPLLGLFLGSLLGWATRLSIGVPTGSLRFLISLLFLVAGASATQISLAVWITSLFQTTIAISILGFFFMKRQSTTELLDDLAQMRTDDGAMPA